jgi:alkanesulfonate monooxygenase SsuD/methylene tetrahydromethanopterin reductase-like flavin-dependent oxidoreductase (luciferase family)
MSPALEFWLYLPQLRLSMDDLAERARTAEAAGFAGIAGMDHLVPPLAEASPMYEAMVTNTWLAAQTESLRVGSLVLCDAFRHPVVLAREAVTLDRASGGRFELGLGWGSVTSEFEMFGVEPRSPAARVRRLRETLEILHALWSGETIDYDGEFFTLRRALQQPTPSAHIPLTIGGAGPRTMELVAAHADWWNLHTHIVDRLDDMRPLAGAARCSLQVQVAFVTAEERRVEIAQTARRRFGTSAVVGTGPQLVEHFAALAEKGIERVYVWFCDFAPSDTLHAFAAEVTSAFTPPCGG